MRLIRSFENAAEIASQGGVGVFGQAVSGVRVMVRGPLHLSTGQEAVPAGVCAHLERADAITSTHRGHGHTIAKGADPTKMMCELFGRASGFNQGKGGSMHIADFSVGMLGANGVVAAGIPIAVGAAHAMKLRGERSVVVCFFGDGAINRGPFLEGLNWARIYDLPVLFVCEDNRYSATTASGPMTGGEGAAARALSIGIESVRCDGNDVEEVDAAARTLIASVRGGGGPRLLHAVTYRQKGHVSVDPASYRDPSELAKALESDPIAAAESKLRTRGVAAHTIATVAAEAEAQIAIAVRTAHEAPWPDASLAYTDIQDTGSGRWL
ncbi:MAG: thiamine pyrophosphate-dependent dehydrogenase E1 component subunit alpha [Burkholderiales bacterium]